jgi:two-component system response regulator YesN
MYKIMIVEDEAIVRKGIKERIDWEEHGFICVGDFENGLEALEALETLRPDIVLSDIYMPFMDGLELAREIHGKYPFTKVIILTGYDDFEYARQALKLKVYDYILKPITANELRNLLDKVKREMDEEMRRREDISLLKSQLHESLPLLRERFLEGLVSSEVNPAEVDKRLVFFNIELPGPDYVVIVVDIDDDGVLRNARRFFVNDTGAHDGRVNYTQTDGDGELLRFAVYNIVGEIMGISSTENNIPQGAVFRNREGVVCAILSGAGAQYLYEHSQFVSEQVRQSVEKYLKFTVSVGIGRPCCGLADIPRSYNSAISALDYRLLLGKNKVIPVTDMEGNRQEMSGDRTEWGKRLVSAIRTGTGTEVEQIIDEMIQYFRASYIPVDRCYLHIQKLIVSLMNLLAEWDGDELAISNGSGNPFTDIYHLKTLEELAAWLKNTCRKAIEYIAGKRSDLNKMQVINAEQYIMENFGNHGISLQDVCKHVVMSTSYFSSVFKSYTGETFVEYLTRVRIDKAKELLKFTDLKTYEIADKVGFADPQYFSVAFRKQSGNSPTEYRQKTMRQ